MRLGYVPVTADEMQGFDSYRVKAGEHVGFIACNEMLLFKLPMDVYQEVMAQMHYEAPLEEEERIRSQVESLSAKDSSGRRLVQMEAGMDRFDQQQPNRAPVFEG
jgi:hypothetical protein